MGFSIYSPLLPFLRLYIGFGENDVNYEEGNVAESQADPPIIKHWGIPLSSWPRMFHRPPVPGKHKAKGAARDRSGKKINNRLYLYSHRGEQVVDAILHPKPRRLELEMMQLRDISS